MARGLGADIAVDYADPGWAGQGTAQAGPVDVVFHGVGGLAGAAALGLLRDGGRFCAYGMASGSFTALPADQTARRGITVIRGAALSPARMRELSVAALGLATAGTLRPLIGQTYPLERAADAHQAIVGRATVGKTLLLTRAAPGPDAPAGLSGWAVTAPGAAGTISRMQRTAVVTGASSGIGAATAVRLAEAGYHVVLAARRADRAEAVADRIRQQGGQADARRLDVTDRPAVDALAGSLDRCDVLVANAGGAIGADTIEDSAAADWLTMYEANVLGTLHVIQALLPKLVTSGAGTIVVMGSTAGFVAYEGGGGYVAAKHAEHAIAATLRLELSGQPVRVIEIAPGMVKTAEFALNRYRGDAEKAAAVYAGVAEPLTDEDIADAIAWTVTRPAHVNIDLMVMRPLAQAAQHKVHREL